MNTDEILDRLEHIYSIFPKGINLQQAWLFHDDKKVIAGVYILIKSGELVYVGKSKDIHRRIRQHWKADKIDFDYIYYFEIFPQHKEFITVFEAYFINTRKPKHNKFFPKSKWLEANNE